MAARTGNQHHLAKVSDAVVHRAVNEVRILGKSRREVARELGVGEATLRDWLKGRTRGRR